MKILITGISGTLGEAFTSLLTKEGCDLIGIDRNEQSVAVFRQAHPDIEVKLGDFADFDFEGQKIDLLIHLAAMKHIDLCEENPSSAVLNNVIKTYGLFKNARRNNVEILFMSTDKAVEPTSVYGHTKVICEKMALEHGGSFARSGNILASNGSVIEIWDKAIENLEPIKITHRKMRRYFITPSSLAHRIWKAYQLGEKTIIPEMDQDVMLLDLLSDRLSLAGWGLEDYPGGIVETGLRPGEKLREKLQ